MNSNKLVVIALLIFCAVCFVVWKETQELRQSIPAAINQLETISNSINELNKSVEEMKDKMRIFREDLNKQEEKLNMSIESNDKFQKATANFVRNFTKSQVQNGLQLNQPIPPH